MSLLGGPKLLVSAVSSWNNSGIKKAETSINKFEKNLKNLGKTLGLTFSAAAVVAFGKASVTAFLADDKAAKSLNQTLKNTGNAFAIPQVTAFIANTEKMTGVLDDQLRPAFQSLLTATGNVYTAQSALNTALDVAAGTTKSVEEVSAALAKAYAGNTTALSRLGIGLSKTTLKTGDMGKIMDEVNAKMGGQAAVAAETYAGKLSKLQVAAKNAQETIGSGLVGALEALSTSGTLSRFTDEVDKLSQAVADFMVGLAILSTRGGKDNPFISIPKKGLAFINQMIDKSFQTGPVGRALQFTTKTGAQARMGSDTSAAPWREVGAQRAMTMAYQKNIDALKAEKKLRDQANADAAAKVRAAADQKVLDDLKKKLDIERIGLVYALSQADSEATKEAIRGKIALLDSDAANAKIANDAIQARYDAEQKFLHDQQERSDAATDAFNKLGIQTKALGDSFDKLSATTGMAAIALAAINTAQNTGERFNPSLTGKGAISTNVSTGFVSSLSGLGVNPNVGGSATTVVAQPVVLPVIVTDTPGFIAAVQDVVQTITRNGSPLSGSSSRGD